MFALNDLMNSMYGVLKGDAVLMSHVTEVYTQQAMAGQLTPYIVFGAPVGVPFDSFQNQGFDITLMVHIFDDLYNGDIYQLILADVMRLLHNQKMPLVTYKPVNTECEWFTIIDDERNRERHIPIRTRSIQQQ